MTSLPPADRILSAADQALRTLFSSHTAARATPRPRGDAAAVEAAPADEQQRKLSAALMRVNHVGEVCAQALYQAQALSTRDPALKSHFEAAARDETDHLAWTEQRLRELGGRTSLLNPLWYAGAFGIGLAAGRVSDKVSLGFVVETERQVEQHLDSHLSRLPADDAASRAIVEQMRDDEARHALDAERAGAVPLPLPVRWLMRGAAKVMTTTAHHV
jgi:3-demethoxyubiquinol 3-hydroxylase